MLPLVHYSTTTARTCRCGIGGEATHLKFLPYSSVLIDYYRVRCPTVNIILLILEKGVFLTYCSTPKLYGTIVDY